MKDDVKVSSEHIYQAFWIINNTIYPLQDNAAEPVIFALPWLQGAPSSPRQMWQENWPDFIYENSQIDAKTDLGICENP